jgi:hypothetical protein
MGTGLEGPKSRRASNRGRRPKTCDRSPPDVVGRQRFRRPAIRRLACLFLLARSSMCLISTFAAAVDPPARSSLARAAEWSSARLCTAAKALRAEPGRGPHSSRAPVSTHETGAFDEVRPTHDIPLNLRNVERDSGLARAGLRAGGASDARCVGWGGQDGIGSGPCSGPVRMSAGWRDGRIWRFDAGFEERDRRTQAIVQAHTRLPSQEGRGPRDVRLPLLGIVLRQR